MSPSTLLVLRNTFRLHDNPALHEALNDPHCGAVMIPIDSDRVLPPEASVPTIVDGTTITTPRFYTWKPEHRHAWGYHQYYLLLHTIRTFAADLQRVHPHLVVSVCKAPVSKLLAVVGTYSNCICDMVDDPAWHLFDIGLAKLYEAHPDRLLTVATHTLLDWREKEHTKFLESWSKKRNNRKFKEYVFAHSLDLGQRVTSADCSVMTRRRAAAPPPPPPPQPPQPKPSPPNTPKRKTGGGSHSRKRTPRKPSTSAPKMVVSLDVMAEISCWEVCMLERGVVPFSPPAHASCEQWALDQLGAHAAELSSSKWEKPKTLAVLTLREYGKRPYQTTSKLSPFLALGVLSPRVAYTKWRGDSVAAHKQNANRPSSAIAQLLWREEFHACASLPGYWNTRQDDASSRFWKRDKEWDIWRGDAEALQPFLQARTTKMPEDLSKAALAKLKLKLTEKNKPVPMEDTNSSLLLLARDGWVHHLRRHTIADYLTRGYLNADWMLGESWFRQTLLDHDASVNRGNWMWLSASDFSTGQLMKHYDHRIYVRKQSGVMTIKTPSTRVQDFKANVIPTPSKQNSRKKGGTKFPKWA